jgi:hypothetical protein
LVRAPSVRLDAGGLDDLAEALVVGPNFRAEVG